MLCSNQASSTMTTSFHSRMAGEIDTYTDAFLIGSDGSDSSIIHLAPLGIMHSMSSFGSVNSLVCFKDFSDVLSKHLHLQNISTLNDDEVCVSHCSRDDNLRNRQAEVED